MAEGTYVPHDMPIMRMGKSDYNRFAVAVAHAKVECRKAIPRLVVTGKAGLRSGTALNSGNVQ